MNCEFKVWDTFPALVGCFAFLLMCLTESTSVAAPRQAPLDIVTNITLVVELKTNQVEVTESLVLKIVLKNHSTNDVTVAVVSKVLDCEVTVRNANGETMPSTRYAKQMARNTSHLGERVVTIPKYSAYLYNIPVSRLYDMTSPDRYRVTAKVRVFARWNRQIVFFDVESDPVDVTILRPAEK
jgi:hypothetical protein